MVFGFLFCCQPLPTARRPVAMTLPRQPHGWATRSVSCGTPFERRDPTDSHADQEEVDAGVTAPTRRTRLGEASIIGGVALVDAAENLIYRLRRRQFPGAKNRLRNRPSADMRQQGR